MGPGRAETDGEGLIVQVLEEERDRSVGEPLGLVDRAVIELPEGDYRLRVDGKGRLGGTFRFAVNRGEMQSYPISIDEGRLLGGEPAAGDEGGKERKAMPVSWPAVTARLCLPAVAEGRSRGMDGEIADSAGWSDREGGLGSQHTGAAR